MKKYGTIFLAAKNIKRKNIRSFGLIAIVAIFAFVLFDASILITNIQRGISTTSQRMGADLMVVPLDYETDFEDILLRSEPSTFYMNEDVEQQVAEIDGVEATSSQLFLQSLNADCCTVPVQLIGFDMERDLTVVPWLEENYDGQLEDGEIVIGSQIIAEVGDILVFYDQEFEVAAKLAETGMGLDSSVYMTFDTAHKMCMNSSQESLHRIAQDGENISCVMVEVQPGYSLDETARDIEDRIEGIDVIITKNFIGSLAEQLDMIAKFLYVLIFFIWIIAVIVIGIIFHITIHERRGEFGLYRALGYSKVKLKRLILAEGLLISIAGSAIGIFIGAMLILSFQNLIIASLSLPYISATTGEIIFFILASILLSVLSVVVICVLASRKIGRLETFLLMREQL